MDRRQFTATFASAAFGGLLNACATRTGALTGQPLQAYGPLVRDPKGLLDLPQGFSYRAISSFGERMSDGLPVPNNADGMGCFGLGGSRIALIRNHELDADEHDLGAFRFAASPGINVYDRDADDRALPGGTTTVVYDLLIEQVVSQHLTLAGTISNCAGGATPWGSWLSCEEDVTSAGQGTHRDHGWIFEVPVHSRATVPPIPLTAMGRFNHEAAAVDERTGIVYLTEDRDDGLLYRFLPAAKGELHRGGRLQALALVGQGLRDSRNWNDRAMAVRVWHEVRWIDLDEVESPADDLRVRGHAKGALLFARGEGIHSGSGELYFCCTSGGAAGFGQVMCYRPSRFEGTREEQREPGRLQLFFESRSAAEFNFGDNLTVAPNGHLLVCEDQYTDVVNNHLRGITPAGDVYTLGFLRTQTELAGCCFSPDGSTLFVNVYSPAQTLAIRGPWRAFAP